MQKSGHGHKRGLSMGSIGGFSEFNSLGSITDRSIDHGNLNVSGN